MATFEYLTNVGPRKHPTERGFVSKSLPMDNKY